MGVKTSKVGFLLPREVELFSPAEFLQLFHTGPLEEEKLGGVGGIEC